MLTDLNSINSTATRIIHHQLPWLRTTYTSFFFSLFLHCLSETLVSSGVSLLSHQWCHTAVLPELLLKWQGVFLGHETQTKALFLDIAVIRRLSCLNQPLLLVHIRLKHYLDCILMMQVLNQLRSGLFSPSWFFYPRAHWRHTMI